MKAWLSKVWAGIKTGLKWVVRIFEDSDGLPSSKRIFGAILMGFGARLSMIGGDPVTIGVLIGGGLGLFGVSAWQK